MSFNDYWEAKAAKRRKAWAATSKRFAKKHTQLEEIRKKVYLPLDYAVNFDFGNERAKGLLAFNSPKRSKAEFYLPLTP